MSNNADNFHQVYQSFRGDTYQTLSEYSYMNTEFDNYLQQHPLISSQIVMVDMVDMDMVDMDMVFRSIFKGSPV